MKYFYITDVLLEESMAETVHVTEICKNLVLQGNEVALFAPRSSYSLDGYSYKSVRIPTPRFLLALFYQMSLLPRLVWEIGKDRPDVIYSRHSLLLALPALVGKICSIPVVLEVNGILIDEERYGGSGIISRLLLASGLLRLIEYFNFACATKIITVTDGIKKKLAERYSLIDEKLIAICNGVDTELFRPIERTEARHILQLPVDGCIVGYVGSFYKWQGLPFVLEAAKVLKERGERISFMFVGSGDDVEYMREYIEQHELAGTVEIVGRVPRESVPYYINAFDICVCVPTSFRDGMTSPFKAYEYLSCARPVILSDTLELRKEFGDTAEYVPPESPKELAAAVTELAHNPAKRKHFSNKGRQFVLDGRSWQSVGKQIDTRIRDIIQEEKHSAVAHLHSS